VSDVVKKSEEGKKRKRAKESGVLFKKMSALVV